jgi:hypothetical protein
LPEDRGYPELFPSIPTIGQPSSHFYRKQDMVYVPTDPKIAEQNMQTTCHREYQQALPEPHPCPARQTLPSHGTGYFIGPCEQTTVRIPPFGQVMLKKIILSIDLEQLRTFSKSRCRFPDGALEFFYNNLIYSSGFDS